MKIAIIGSGNIGTALAADLAQHHIVNVYSSRPQLFEKEITYIDMESGKKVNAQLNKVSNQYEEVIEDADLIFLAVPTFLIRKTSLEILKYLHRKTMIGFVPGAGGVEFLAKELIDNGHIIFGFLRVPYVARLNEYGKSVYASKKESFKIAAIPRTCTHQISQKMSDLLNRPCFDIDNFLSMTLTPTLHTSRLYDLYQAVDAQTMLWEDPYFYADWTNSSSKVCLELDDELHLVAKCLEEKYGLDMHDLVSYRIHYESPTIEALTVKHRSIKSLSQIKGPLKKENDYFLLDMDSRYFTESYPYRLSIVKGIADLLSISVPKTDEVLSWYSKISHKDYYIDGKFIGKDVEECAIPQNFGISHIAEFLKLYQ